MKIDREDWPSTITGIKTVSYDVETVYQNILSDNRASDGELEITFEDVMNVIESYVIDDFSCGWGHPANLKDIVFVDDDGNEH